MRIGGPRPAGSAVGKSVVSQIVDALPQPTAPPPRAKKAVKKVTMPCRVCLKNDEPKVRGGSQRSSVPSWSSASLALRLLRRWLTAHTAAAAADPADGAAAAEHVCAVLVLQEARNWSGPPALLKSSHRNTPGASPLCQPASRLPAFTSPTSHHPTSHHPHLSLCCRSNETTPPPAHGAPCATTSSKVCDGETSRGHPSAAKKALT